MKRIFAVLATVMLVFGVAGNAMAYFDNVSDLILVAYEGAPGGTATGSEVLLDLGNMDGSELPTASWDTGISVSDFSTAATSWSSITIGLIGGDATTKVFGSDAGTNAVADVSSFNSGQTYLAYGPVYGATTQKVVSAKNAFGSYSGAFNSSGVAGYYATAVTPSNYPAGANSQNAEVLMGVGSYEMGIWSSDDYNTATLMGTLVLSATDGGNLFISYAEASAVPVPAAVWLLGSGLLGLLGIRRRNA